MRTGWLCLLAIAACDTGRLATDTTSKVLVRAVPAMEQESDYELAAAAMPGQLKTVEGFHLAYPDNRRLTGLLARGYCQYAAGMVEDEWEVAAWERRDGDTARWAARRTAAMFARCMN